jgi:pSer/pThr/pTyr-binding forkhead associated (FHA) protein
MGPAEILLILRIIIAVALYAFLSLLLITLWRDLKEREGRRITTPTAHLLTISGEGLRKAYQLEEVNLLGRAKDNTLTLPESTISAYHARISCRDGTWWLEDMGSRNGTSINDIPVSEPAVITFGDEIHLGSVIVRFCSGPIPAVSSGGDVPVDEGVN